jgi:hypothetical protein
VQIGKIFDKLRPVRNAYTGELPMPDTWGKHDDFYFYDEYGSRKMTPPLFREKIPKQNKNKTKEKKPKMPKIVTDVVEEKPKIKAKSKATLIKLEDQRQIICSPEIANLMIEFAKTFNAQVYKIEFETPQEIELMDLDETVAFICENKSNAEIPAHKIITILIKPEDKFPKELKNAVASILALEKNVKADQLAAKFPKIGIKVIKEYLKELGTKIKSDGLLNIEIDENYLKVS